MSDLEDEAMNEWTNDDLERVMAIQAKAASQVGKITEFQIALSLLLALVALCDAYDQDIISGDEVCSFLAYTARLPIMPPLPSEAPELYMQKVDDNKYTPEQMRAFQFAIHRCVETLAGIGEDYSLSEESLKYAVVSALLMMCRDYEEGKADAAGVVVLGQLFDEVW